MSVAVFAWPFSADSESYALLFPKFLYPINTIIFCCSIFLILAIARERYIAICHPMFHMLNVATKTVSRRLFSTIVPVVVFGIVLNMPKFFETELVRTPLVLNKTCSPEYEADGRCDWGWEEGEETRVAFVITAMRNNFYYIIFYFLPLLPSPFITTF